MSAGPVVIVGGGPAGLAAAVELRRRGVPEVLVLEREAAAGGIPRHAQHQGFGLRDLHRPLSGPGYARRYAELAAAAGAELRTETMVTGWAPGGPLELTGPRGREQLEPAAVVLATGCRERPRSARLVPGSRPEGVMTTGTLQQLVYLKGLTPGTRALVVGAEHVSFSALLTLAHGGARAVGMVTELPRHQSLAAVPSRCGPALPDAALDAHCAHRDPRTPAGGGGGAHRSRQRCGAPRGVRHRRLQRGLDPRPRARRDGGPRDGRGHARSGRGHGAANVETRRLRGRQPRCMAPRRPTWPRSEAATRGPLRPSSWRTAAPGRTCASRSSASHRCGGSRRTSWWRVPERHHGDASRFARRALCSVPAWKSRRPVARSGRAASGGSCRAAPPLCRRRGPRRSTRAAGR